MLYKKKAKNVFKIEFRFHAFQETPEMLEIHALYYRKL